MIGTLIGDMVAWNYENNKNIEYETIDFITATCSLHSLYRTD